MYNARMTRLQSLSRWFVPAAFLLVFFGWMTFAPPGTLGKVDAIGYAVCHQIDARSFHFLDGPHEGETSPLCARCSGMYLGAVLGIAGMALFSPRRGGIPTRAALVALGLFFVAFGFDGVNSYLFLLRQTYPGLLPQIPQLYEPNNTLRLFTGFGMGLAIAAMLMPALNQTVWKDWNPAPALDLRKLLGFAAVCVLLAFGILSESSWILYPAAYISALGVPLVLSLVYGMVWVMLMRQENAFTHVRQLWLALFAGATLAFIQIFAIDLARFTFTGTWGAFPGIG
jgi:uncharacterized membrane protein